MNKRTFMIIISCVTIFCIIAGAFINLRHVGPSVSKVGRSVSRSVRNSIKNARNNDYDYDFDDDFDMDLELDDLDSDPGAKKFTNTLESFEEVSINAKVMGVTIERGNRFEVSGSYTKAALKPNISVSGGTLKISQPDYKYKMVTNGNCKIAITVPFGTQLESINANIDVGAIELKGIDVEDIDLNTDVGAIAVNNVEFNELKANSDVGAVALELTKPLSEYNIDARSDVGAIQVDGASVKRKYNRQGSTNKRIKIKTDVGGIDIQ